MNKNFDCYENNNDKDCKCKSITKKPVDISTPVKIEPIVNVGKITTECSKSEICWNTEKKPDCKRACEFVIKKTIYVEIPICYDVDVQVNPSYIDCK